MRELREDESCECTPLPACVGASCVDEPDGGCDEPAVSIVMVCSGVVEERALTVCFKELWRSEVISRRTDASALWLGHIKSLSRPESDVIFRPWQDNAGRGFLDTVPWCCSSVLIATVVSYVHNAPLMWNAESLRPSVGMSRGLSHSSTGNSSCCTTCTLLSCTKHITVKLSLSAPEPINTESAAGLVVFMIARRLYVVRNPQKS